MSDANRAETRETFCREMRAMWWLMLIRGLLLIMVGAYALFNPAMTTVALAQVVGFYLCLDGALAIYAGATGRTDSRIWTIIRGIILILAGLFAISHPIIMAMVNITFLVCMLAVGSILSGIVEIYAAIRDRREIEGEGWLILSGALAIAFGIILLISPLAGGMMIVQFLGAFGIIAGISLIGLAFRLRSFGSKLKKKT